MSLPCCLCQVLRLHNCTFYKLTTRKLTKNLRYNVHTDILCHQILCLWHSTETLYITSTFLKVLTNFSFFFSHFLYSSFTVSVIDQGEVIMTHNPQLQYGHGFDLQTGQIWRNLQLGCPSQDILHMTGLACLSSEGWVKRPDIKGSCKTMTQHIMFSELHPAKHRSKSRITIKVLPLLLSLPPFLQAQSVSIYFLPQMKQMLYVC